MSICADHFLKVLDLSNLSGIVEYLPEELYIKVKACTPINLIEKALEKSPKDAETLEEIDAEWKEAEAFTDDPLAAAAADCNSCNAFQNATETLVK